MKRLIFAMAFIACAAIAQAQQMPPGKWWRRPEVIQQLQLSGDQQDRLDEIFRGAADDLIDARAAVEKLQVAIRGELDRPQVRKQELQRIARQLNDARGRLFERELMMLADMRAVLKEEQWRKMRDFLDRRGPGPQQRRRK